MTQSPPQTTGSSSRPDGEPAVPAQSPSGGGAVPRDADSPTWWRRTWVLPIAVIAVLFVLYSLPPYLTGDPSKSRIPMADSTYPLHYQMLVGHIVFGSIALLTAVLQIWPRLRRTYPAVHRWSGRVYILAGALPSALVALYITPVSAGPPGNFVTAVLWIGTTLAGWYYARTRQYVKHRRWMIYSFALAFTILHGRLIFFVVPFVPGYNEGWIPVTAETATWIGFTINLLIAQWWLERTAGREKELVSMKKKRPVAARAS